MNQPKRYKFNAVLLNGEAALCMMETDGKYSYVHHSDYAAVAAENERLRKLLEMYLKADPLIGEAVASAMLAAKEGNSK